MKRAASQAPKPRKRPFDGVLFLDKPAGITSQTAVLKAKHLYSAAKAGHTGTLDPMASGLLPVCFGEATKFSHLLLDADKQYAATIRLGVVTSTGDMEGEIISTHPVSVERSDVEGALGRFVGEILQTPPMYSALKHQGKPLYRYARAGLEVKREPRRVCIHHVHLENHAGNELQVSVACSKGTYIRVLAEDIGRALGCGGSLSALRRTGVGALRVEEAVGLDFLHGLDAQERERHVRPIDTLVAALPRIDLDASQARRIRSGLTLDSFALLPLGLVRLYGPERDYLGIATVEPHGALVPRRLMATAPARPAERKRCPEQPDIA